MGRRLGGPSRCGGGRLLDAVRRWYTEVQGQEKKETYRSAAGPRGLGVSQIIPKMDTLRISTGDLRRVTVVI